MKQAAASLAVLAISLGLSVPAGAVQPVYDLRHRPKFSKGDLVTAACKRASRISSAGSDEEAGYLVVTTTESLENQHVEAVDEDRQVVSFHQNVSSAQMRYTLKAADRPTRRAAIELQDIRFQAGRTQNSFSADTTTVASAAHESLTAPQLWLAKRFIHDRMKLHAFCPDNIVVMPAQPVPAGHKWRPPLDAITKWARSFALFSGVTIDSPTGSFQLSGARGLFATVRGSVTFGCQFRSMQARAKMDMSCKIDTATGCWTSESCKIELVARSGERLVRLQIATEAETVYQARKPGDPDGSSSVLHDLGWAPAEDTGKASYHSSALGVSLAVPGNYRRRKGAKRHTMTFSTGDGRSVSLSAKLPAVPVELTRLTDAALRKLQRTVADYRLIRRERLPLPDNVPSVLLTASGKGGSMIIFTLVAVDGPRIVSVTAAGIAGRPKHIEELRQIVTSLRLFEPDLNATE